MWTDFLAFKEGGNISLTGLVACNHMRAVDIFGNSLRNTSIGYLPVGYECASIRRLQKSKHNTKFKAKMSWEMIFLYSCSNRDFAPAADRLI